MQQLTSSIPVQDAVTRRLDHLHELLTSLPGTLPIGNTHYDFRIFQISEDDIDMSSEPGAVNHAFEIAFCRWGRTEGPIKLIERGPGLVAVVDVLREYTTKYPQDMVLQKWIHDLSVAAEYQYAQATSSTKAGASGSSATTAAGVQSAHVPGAEDDTSSSDESKSESDTEPVKQKKRHAPGNKSGAKKCKVAEVVTLDDFSDHEEPAKTGKGGRPRARILDEVSVFTRLKRDPDPKKRYWRCIGVAAGCDQYWSVSRNKTRVLAHAAQCSRVPHALKDRVNEELAMEAPSTKLERAKARRALPHKQKSKQTESASASLYTASNEAVASGSSSKPAGFKPLDAAALKESSVYTMSKRAAKDQLQKQLDFDVVKLLAVGGIPPSKVDLPEWKELWRHANPSYEPPSASTIEENHLPREAARIKQLALEHLQSAHNLTITFDGGTTKGNQSVYTVHITTPDRRVFLWEGNEASDQSHTAEHIYKLLRVIIVTIGAHLFCGIGSDNTGNTRLAREMIHADFPWIQILPDPCHRLSLLCKDIARIEYGAPVIKNVRATVKYFKKSTFAATHLKKRRARLGITRGLISIGKTRFATLYFSSESVRRCLPAIRELCQENVVKVPNINNLFVPGRKTTQFAFKLEEFASLLSPIAKSITCLESSHSTVSDVYIFWLATMAEIHSWLTNIDENELEVKFKEDIRRAANYRFNEMFDGKPGDVYLTGFILDPRYRGASILHDLNPLSVGRIKIPGARPPPASHVTGTSQQASSDELPATLRRVGNYLLRMLRVDYESKKSKISNIDSVHAVAALKEQIIQFVKGVYPYNRPMRDGEGPREWWERLNEEAVTEAQPLAYLATRIFAMTPNSMNDERTASVFTWLNSPLRNRMKVATLVRTTQIRMWHRHKPETAAPKSIPTVKYRDMSTLLYSATVQQSVTDDTVSEESDEEPEIESDDNDTGGAEDVRQREDGLGDAPSEHFVAALIADLAALELSDILSDTPVVVQSSKTPSPQERTENRRPAKRTLSEEDWKM